MYVYDTTVEAGVAVKLAGPVIFDKNGKEISDAQK
jgi:hypothetical protein